MTDLAIITQTIATLFPTGCVTELRILHTPRQGTVSGYFDDQYALAKAAAQWSGRAPAVYATLNPCNPALLARAANRLKDRVPTTTTDTDIVRRLWFPLDFDPVRPAGISSTDHEHETALARAAACADWLAQRGWPAPVAADSGNGGHLLYAIDLPNNDASRMLVQRCLEALALYFTDDAVALDTSVFNAARIWKLYGTMACKGDNLPERPHRISWILTVPPTRICAATDQLEALVAMAPEPVQTALQQRSGQAMDIPAWIAKHQLQVGKEGSWQQGGYRWVLNPCPWNAAHTDNSAYIVQFANGAVAAGCWHNGCQGKKWHALRDLCEPGWDAYGGFSSQLLRNGDGSVDPHEIRASAFSSLNSLSSQAVRKKNWPVLQPEALQGLAGDFVRALEPQTEADPVALLAQFLTEFGIAAGRHSYATVGADRHYGNLFVGVVGQTARSRKGMSYGYIAGPMHAADPTWGPDHHIKGAGSGEGLIYAVRDPRSKLSPIKNKGRIVEY